ncbi:hypothetical protein [Streptomyces sp. JB150]|nr:hypothetical protein [Streptomyces sp. JB150]
MTAETEPRPQPADVRKPEPTPDLPPLPQEPKARRRALAVRGW